MDYAIEEGFALRYDAFRPKPPVSYASRVMQRHWKSRFIVGEPGYRRPHPEGPGSIACGWCPREAKAVLVEMLRHHANFISLGVEPRQWPEFTRRHQELIALGRQYLGYRLAVRAARYPSPLEAGARFVMDMEWSNFGVGRLYPPSRLHGYLTDPAGEVVWHGEDRCEEWATRPILHGGEFEEGATDWVERARRVPVHVCFDLPREVPAGRYTLRIALVAGGRALALAQEDGDTAHRYRLGEVWVDGGLQVAR